MIFIIVYNIYHSLCYLSQFMLFIMVYVIYHTVGETCEYDIDECQDRRICHHGGKCINNAGSYRCVCPTGYEGNQCQNRGQFKVIKEVLVTGTAAPFHC